MLTNHKDTNEDRQFIKKTIEYRQVMLTTNERQFIKKTDKDQQVVSETNEDR